MTTSAHTRRSKGSPPAAKPQAHTARTARASTAELDDWLAAETEIDGQRLLADQLAHSDT